MEKSTTTPLTPTDLVYTALCPRKLWLHKNGIRLEKENENVQIGKVISKETFTKYKKELPLFNFGVLDSAVLKNGAIIEIKKSSRYEHLHIIQVSAYLEWMQLHGINITHGILKYPKEKKTKRVILSDEMTGILKSLKQKAKETLSLDNPPPAQKIKACGSCAYERFCWL